MLNVLLIDDDNLEQTFMERTLKSALESLFNLEYATTLEAGVDILKHKPVDVIFLDDNLGRGLMAKDNARTLQDVSDSIPIIVISNFVDLDHLASSAFMNVHDVVEKNELKDRIERGLLKPFLSVSAA